MKSLVFSLITVFSVFVHADVKITAITGVTSIEGAGNSILLGVDSNTIEEVTITFLSTETIGTPRLTFTALSGATYILPTVSDTIFTNYVNRQVTLRIPAYLLCERLVDELGKGINTAVLKVGFDENSDGDLEDSGDDTLAFSVEF